MSDQFDAKAFLKTVTSQPGVYRMYDAGGTVIYVGKAKDLKKRLSSYFRSNLASRKTEALVAQIQQIDVTVTHTETEALLLEHNYIKLYQPRYNVLLRDDKSYPFIFLSGDTHPRLAMHRGAKHAKGEYFGPFPNGYAVRETLALLQKICPIRQCENSVYRNRSRPSFFFAGEPSQNVGRSFIKSYCAVCLEGVIIVLACIIFSVFAASPPVVNPDAAAVTMVWSYIGELVFNMLVLVGAVKMADRVVREMMGL